MSDFEPDKIKISAMDKTWILDLDGTIVYHDGPYYLGRDRFCQTDFQIDSNMTTMYD